MTGADPTAELEAIRNLPLEKRYVWRIASALKWAFADCDDMNVDADRRTMSVEDFATRNHAITTARLTDSDPPCKP
jgi:hypothetical protein